VGSGFGSLEGRTSRDVLSQNLTIGFTDDFD
jgi:hypothetical protein